MKSTRRLRRSSLGAALALALGLSAGAGAAEAQVHPAPDANSVLIHDMFGGVHAGSAVAVEAAGLGYTVEIVDDTTWGAMTGADFASYRALILGGNDGDAGCETSFPAKLVATRTTWSPKVTGNAVVITGPVSRFAVLDGIASQRTLIRQGIAFAAGAPGTGLYASTNCMGFDRDFGAPVLADALDEFGQFYLYHYHTLSTSPLTYQFCPLSSHIVVPDGSTHPVMAGLGDGDLEDVYDSIACNANLQTSAAQWPGSFTVLAINHYGLPGAYTGPDGSNGQPRIFARGVAPKCGNGVLEAGEECDDGNLTPGDGCDDLCRIECEDLGDEVLIHDHGGAIGPGSVLPTEVAAAGLVPVLVDDTTWNAMSTADFARYRALVVGGPDDSCQSVAAAVTATSATWGAAVEGNMAMLAGPVEKFAGADGIASQRTLVRQAIEYAAGNPHKTGLFFSTGCEGFDHADTFARKIVAMEWYGVFTVFHYYQINPSPPPFDYVFCPDFSHIVDPTGTTSPVMAGLADADLEDVYDSIACNANLQTSFKVWDPSFDVLAIHNYGHPGVIVPDFVGPDGVKGQPGVLTFASKPVEGCESCGDGVVDPGEECDDGNAVDADCCKSDCTLNVCGDGVLFNIACASPSAPPFEQCDDGNLTPGDGCDAMCRLEPGEIECCVDLDADGWLAIDTVANPDECVVFLSSGDKHTIYGPCSPDGTVVPLDCDDADAAIHPGAAEIPGNGVDENCNGFVSCGAVSDDAGAPWRVAVAVLPFLAVLVLRRRMRR